MSRGEAPPKKEGISVQTLVIAAVASALSAVIVREVWGSGTVFAAAITPVLVTLLTESLKKPAATVSKVVTVNRTTPTGTRVEERVEVPANGRNIAEDVSTDEYDPVVGTPPPHEAPPAGESGVRVFRGEREIGPPAGRRAGGERRLSPKHIRIAVATGLLAFAIAAAALTLPELLFGSAANGSGGGTTFFGGGKPSDPSSSDAKRTTTEENGETKTVTEPAKTTTTQTETQPRTAPDRSSTTSPSTTPQARTAPGAGGAQPDGSTTPQPQTAPGDAGDGGAAPAPSG